MPERAVQAGIEPLAFVGEPGELDNPRALEEDAGLLRRFLGRDIVQVAK
jgi:hypothetical protein